MTLIWIDFNEDPINPQSLTTKNMVSSSHFEIKPAAGRLYLQCKRDVQLSRTTLTPTPLLSGLLCIYIYDSG